MRLSTAVNYTGSPRTVARKAADLERAGIEIIWVPEAYGFDGPTLMGYLAALTDRVQIGSSILNVFSRTPAALAQTAAGLDHLSEGRAILGLGASGPQVIEGFHGVPFDRPLGRTRAVVDVVRQALRREPLSASGIFELPLTADGGGTGFGKPLKMISHPHRSTVPIFLAALGPANVRLAAEIADGWVPFLYLPEHAPTVWGQSLADGASLRASDLGPLEVVAGGRLQVCNSEDEVRAALEAVRPRLALYVGGMGAQGTNFYFDLVSRYGYEAAAHEIQEHFLAHRVTEAERAVPLELLTLTNLVGTEGYIRDRIAAYRDSGVTILNVDVHDPDPRRLVSAVAEWAS
ncbi:LLM class F420-dependent oxidoreductase [Mycolicibacterium fortuitum]|uniref:LLM class F420-dependent oxidoreductase n=1 Tax=Mycolicibacterium fortuitum TaxID=1766 RepID=UPI0006CAE4BB|nr:LLM class F420-dependent oxidoreductase [Mycolicibacterium fortuitum]